MSARTQTPTEHCPKRPSASEMDKTYCCAHRHRGSAVAVDAAGSPVRARVKKGAFLFLPQIVIG